MAETVFGIHAVRAALARADKVFVAADNRRAQDLARRAQACGVAVVAAGKDELEQIAGRGARHQGVAAYCRPAENPAWRDAVGRAQTPLIVVLDGVTDPRNLGACLRAAGFFGADCVVAPRRRSAPLSAVAAKAASGAPTPLCRVANLARALAEMRRAGVRVIGADADAPDSVYQTELSGGVAWVFGGEGGGLRRLTAENCDRRVKIPGDGCLNVASACAVCLAETRRRRMTAEGG